MQADHNKATIVSLVVVATAICSLLHEGLGHGVTAWLRNDIVTQLTSNHLSSIRHDRLVDAGGTLVNLFAGLICLFAAGAVGRRANLRFFLWFMAAMNLLLGAGYFLFSGVLGLGDWGQFIEGMPHQAVLRIVMAIVGAVLYVVFVRLLAVAVHPFAPDQRAYNVPGRLPYYTACIFMCAAGAPDPEGIKLLFLSTVPALVGGLSGLMWADWLLPRTAPAYRLYVRRSPATWVLAIVVGGAFIATVGRGINFPQ